MIDFTNIEYLKNGNPKQMGVYKLLKEYEVLKKISCFNPLLAGTIPINIDIPNSDLDIICFWESKIDFINLLNQLFNNFSKYNLKETTNRGFETIIARFKIENYLIEIFGQNRPSETQEAYRHMLIEHEIIQQKGETFRQQIVSLKMQGIKTEPAFAKLLGIDGNPYDELLNFKING